METALAGLEIDVLINNAGVSRTGNILSADAFAVDEQVEVNIQAVLHLVCKRQGDPIFRVIAA